MVGWWIVTPLRTMPDYRRIEQYESNFLKLDNTSKTKFLLNRKISFINTGETSILTLSISVTRY